MADLVIKGNLSYFKFNCFKMFPELLAGIFTRKGGHSFGDKKELNMALNSENPEDSLEDVTKNITLAKDALGLTGPIVTVKQTHSSNVFFLNSQERSYEENSVIELGEGQGFDAVVIQGSGINALIKLADCQGLVLYEPKEKVLALVHSGWKGSVQNIIGKTIGEMEKKLNLDPANLVCAITPSLGPCCGEFKNYENELPKEFLAYKDHNDYFDFWSISRLQLKEAGLRDGHIEIAGICSKCHEDCFSFRRGDIFGRMGLLAGIKKIENNYGN